MKTILGAFVVSLGLAVPASASQLLPPGYGWYTCSAPHDCSGPAYVRKLYATPKRALFVRKRHLRSVHHVPLVPKVVAHRKVKAVAFRVPRQGPFQVIYDPQFAAVAAWADIVNSEARVTRW